MKNLSIKFGNQTIGLRVPGIGRDHSFAQSILEVFDSLHTFLFFILSFFIPLSIIIFHNDSNESSSYAFIIASLTIIYGVYAASLIIKSKYRVKDPIGIFNILIFALLTTLAAVLISPPDSANTFGTLDSVVSESHKALSGLAVISYIAIFYLLTLNLKKESHINKFLNYISFGFGLYLVLAFLDNNLLTESHIVLVLILIFLSLEVLLVKKNLLLYYLPVILIGLFLLTKYSFEIPDIFTTLFVIFVSALPIYIVVLAKFKSNFIESINVILNSLSELFTSEDGKTKLNIRALQDILESTRNLLFVLSIPALLIILGIIVASQNHVTDVFEVSLNSISNSIEIINSSVLDTFVGIGTSKASALAVNPNLYSQILIGQGVIGMAAYLFLFIYAAIFSIKLLLNNIFQNRSFLLKCVLISTFFVFLIPVLGFFSYPGYFLLILWWIFTGIIFSIATILKVRHTEITLSEMYRVEDFRIGKFKINSKVTVMLSILFATFAIILSLLFLSIRGEVV